MLDYALAICAIMSSETGDCRRDAVRTVALGMELIDPRECRFLFADDKDFADDLRLVFRRYQELADAPPAWDAARFPGREYVTDAICFNRLYKSHLEDRAKLFNDEWIAEAIMECDQLYAIYDCLRDAKCDYYYLTGRRKALAKLRDLIGPIHYYSGTLPPFVPVWRFRRID